MLALLSHHVWLKLRVYFQIWCKQQKLSHYDCTSVWGIKFSWSIVWALVASHGQHLVGQKYSGEDKGCIRCATFHLDCYWSSCWTIKKTVYKSLVPWQKFAVCVRACSYKAQIVFRYCWLWSMDRSKSFLISTHVFASKQWFTCYSQQTLKLYINSTSCNTF